jgi:hypothetical protein
MNFQLMMALPVKQVTDTATLFTDFFLSPRTELASSSNMALLTLAFSNNICLVPALPSSRI